ncbi:MAG: hypothetical protein ACR2JK_19140 [Geodermatophilaceae bacterium]
MLGESCAAARVAGHGGGPIRFTSRLSRADWLTEHYAGLTFETVYVIVNSPRWVVVRRVARADVEHVEEIP